MVSLRAAATAALLLALAASGPPVLGAATPRIVSLIPSLTEDLFAIGAGSQVVGVSAFTDYPPVASALPAVATATSLDLERIVRLHPDVVVGISAQRSFARDLRRAGLSPVLLSDDSFDDIFADLLALGRMSGHPSQSQRLVERLQRRTRELVRRLPREPAPRTFVVLGVAPIYTVGDASYIARLIALAGGRNAAADLPLAYGRYSAEALVALAPDAIVADRQSGLQGVLDRAPWTALRAVREKRVYFLDDADILERPGPRYNEGLAWLIARLHPRAPADR
jgi:iron complex transport system substrate-binding protein